MSCERQLAHMSELALRELGATTGVASLGEQHLAEHLPRCSACASAYARVRDGLQAARAYQPEVSAEHLVRLQARLDPYLEAGRPVRRSTYVRLLVPAVSSALVALLVVLWWTSSPGPAPDTDAGKVAAASAPQAAEQLVDMSEVAAPAQPGAMRRLAAGPFVHILASADWRAVTRAEGAATHVTMERGFAGFSFVGGDGRQLLVQTPLGSVHVRGTRFWVELSPATLRVQVRDGRVDVVSPSARRQVAAGEAVLVDGTGAIRAALPASAVAAWLDDDHLRLHHAQAQLRAPHRAGSVAATAAPRQAPGEAIAAAPPLDDEALLARLQAAEALAEQGRPEEALAAYRAVAEQGGAAYRNLARYEIARLWGFALGQPDKAAQLLGELVHAGGEVQRQAALALCELDRKRAPCAAKACLAALAKQDGGELGREAARLVSRWGLAQLGCADGEAR